MARARSTGRGGPTASFDPPTPADLQRRVAEADPAAADVLAEGLVGTPSTRGRIVRRVLMLLVAAGGLYLVAPSLQATIESTPRLRTVSPWWVLPAAVAEAASFGCVWVLQRVLLRTARWFPVAASQLAGNAVSRVVPGGGAVGVAVQYRMLGTAGIDAGAAASGLAAASILVTAATFALPLVALPFLGRGVDDGLRQAAVLGAFAFLVLGAIAAVLLTTRRPLELVGGAVEWVLRQLRPKHPAPSGVGARLVRERNLLRQALGRHWGIAVLTIMGRLGFDYLALLAALTAVGARPRPALVLLAFAASLALGMIPITPGGLGFVEAGLAAALTLAGVETGDAVLATLVYRLLSYWLPLVAGLIAYWLFRARYRPGNGGRAGTAGAGAR